MNKPLVSVVIPSYGGGEFLQRAVNSVLQQTYPNVEAIVVDDNGLGTPNQLATAEKMAEYKANERVKYICHKVNKNGSAARNTGVDHSTAKYIALLDDDDEFLPHKIEKQVEDIENLDDRYALVYCGLETFLNGKSLGYKHKTHSGSLLFEVLMHQAVIGSSSLLIKREVWNKLGGFDESFRRHQDWEFTARVAYAYMVKAEDFIGFNRYLTQRNSPKNPDTVMMYRKHYIEKMLPYMSVLPKEQQEMVRVSNLMDACIQYVKYKRWRDFFNIYRSIKPGMLGVKMIYRRILLIIKRGQITIN